MQKRSRHSLVALPLVGLLTLAAIGWIAGFLGFAAVFGPMLLRSRLAS